MKLSASLIKTYKLCRRKYELKYIEELEPIAKSQALEDGSNYHNMVEALYTGEGEYGYAEGRNPKICAMAYAYLLYVYPQIPNIKYAEKWFDYKLTPKHNIVGRFDAVTEDGIIVEHKTTSGDVDDEYVYSLQWDEQILTYMLATGTTEMYYTVIKKPTIRQKQNETEEQFYDRCVQWYAEETDKKVGMIKVTRSENEVKEHRKNLLVMANEIDKCKSFYRNPMACTCYNRRCEYASVCLNYNPDLQYVEFEKKQRHADSVQEKENLF